MVSKKQQFDLMTMAMEGGANYWYNLPDLSMIPAKGYTPKTKEIKEELYIKDCLVARIWEAVEAGKEIPVSDIETDEVLGMLTKKSFRNAVELLYTPEYRSHLGSILKETDDAMTGDVFLQLVVMGKVVFG